MIAKDESLSVVMDALNQVRKRCRAEKLLLHSHNVTGRAAASFSKTERFGFICLMHFLSDDTIASGRHFLSHFVVIRSACSKIILKSLSTFFLILCISFNTLDTS